VRHRPEPPAVVVRHDGAPAAVLREVAAGAEEEGVPTRVEAAATGEAAPADAAAHAAALGRTGAARAAALGHTAALASPLEVGVGVDAAGALAVHHATLPPDAPALSIGPGGDPPQWRRAGAVAARIVTGLPIA
jgi:hypothetical protein